MGKRVALVSLFCLIIGTTHQKSLEKPIEPLAEPTGVTLAFVGDLMAHRENLAATSYDNAFEYIAPFLRKADLAFANFEFVADPDRKPSGYPRFNVPETYIQAAFDAGIDVVSLANNHSFDFGANGVIATIETMNKLSETYGIAFSGTRANAGSTFEFEMIEVNDITIGFLAVTSFVNQYMRTGHVNIADYRRSDDRAALLETVRSVRSTYDVIVLSYHGGVEYSERAEPEKVRFFEELIDSGADIVWGHHPHVLQPCTRYTGAHRSGFIMQSLGNFLSGQSAYIDPLDPDDERGPRGESVLVTLKVTKPGDSDVENDDAESGPQQIEIRSVEMIPIVHYPDVDEVIRVLPLDAVEKTEISPVWRRYFASRRSRLAKLLGPHLALADPKR